MGLRPKPRRYGGNESRGNVKTFSSFAHTSEKPNETAEGAVLENSVLFGIVRKITNNFIILEGFKEGLRNEVLTMEMVSVRMDLPKDVLLAANIPEANATADIRKHLALYMFKERILSLGKAAELSGIGKLPFMEFAGSKGVSLNYDTDDYYEDMNTIKGMDL